MGSFYPRIGSGGNEELKNKEVNGIDIHRFRPPDAVETARALFPLIQLSLGERTSRPFDALCAPEPQVGPLTTALSPLEGEKENRRQVIGDSRVSV
jgi:hypothetical protein